MLVGSERVVPVGIWTSPGNMTAAASLLTTGWAKVVAEAAKAKASKSKEGDWLLRMSLDDWMLARNALHFLSFRSLASSNMFFRWKMVNPPPSLLRFICRA